MKDFKCISSLPRGIVMGVEFPADWLQGFDEEWEKSAYGQDEIYSYIRFRNGYSVGLCPLISGGKPFMGYIRLEEPNDVVWSGPTPNWVRQEFTMAKFSFINHEVHTIIV